MSPAPPNAFWDKDAVLTCRVRSCMLKTSRRGTLQTLCPPCPRQGQHVGSVSDVQEGGGGSLFLFPCRAVSFRSSSFSGRPRRISGCAPGRARHMVRPIICLPDLLCAVLAFCDEVPYLKSVLSRGVEVFSVAPPVVAGCDTVSPAPFIICVST